MTRCLVLLTTCCCILLLSGPVLGEDPGELQGSELQAMTDTLQFALEKNQTNQSSSWVNPDTGRSGEAVPIKTFTGGSGQPCREFITTIIIGDQEEQGYGTACRQTDGSWQLSPDAQPSGGMTQPPPQLESYRVEPPVEYYAFPTGFYGPSRIFLSFSYVYRSGRLHYGTRYLDGPTFRQRYIHPVRNRVYLGPRLLDRYRLRDEWRYRDWERSRHDRHDRQDRHDDRQDRRGNNGKRRHGHE
jgi:surface antigen